ncbi:MAG TPA: peptide deformylase [Ktedonobacterales bacterium]|jgi:peptide deformylase|nr:peptide deformylase [Ktedonobacterales bacterium]
MAIRPILTREQPVLRKKCIKVSRFDASLERLIQDMWETMYDAPGVGLAAPQVGVPLRVLVAEWREEREDGDHEDHVALVNPEIVKRSSEELTGTEGCLSIPGFVGDNIRRATWVTVKARDPKGKEVRIHAEGWFARVLQHEIDHLDGVLFTDRLDRREDLREVSEEEARADAEGQPAPGARAKPATPRARVNGANNAHARAESAPATNTPANTRAGTPASTR